MRIDDELERRVRLRLAQRDQDLNAIVPRRPALDGLIAARRRNGTGAIARGAFALGATAIVAVAMASVVMTRGAGVGDPSSEAPSADASNSFASTQSPATTLSPSEIAPSPSIGTLTAEPVKGPRLVTLAVSDVNANTVVRWSPDSSAFAVVNVAGPGVTHGNTVLFEANGLQLASVDATDIGWLDARTYVAFRPTDPVTGAGTAWMGSVAQDSTTTITGSFSGIVAASQGRVALSYFAADSTRAEYALVSTGKLEARRPGVPIAWSADGAMLAVLHVTQPQVSIGGSDSGWVEITNAADGSSVQSFRSTKVGRLDRVAFSRDGRYLGFGGESSSVIEVSTGKVSRLAATYVRSLGWMPDGTILVDTNASNLSVWRAGSTQQTQMVSGWYWSVSSAGVVADGDGQASAKLTIYESDGVQSLDLPASLASWPAWAWNGRSLVAICEGSAVLIIPPASSN
jgi:hypothetical protein